MLHGKYCKEPGKYLKKSNNYWESTGKVVETYQESTVKVPS